MTNGRNAVAFNLGRLRVNKNFYKKREWFQSRKEKEDYFVIAAFLSTAKPALVVEGAF